MPSSEQLTRLLKRMKQQRYVTLASWSQRNHCPPLTRSEQRSLISILEYLVKKSNA